MSDAPVSSTPPIGGSEQGLRREITAIGFGAIALNGLIGAGIFALPGTAIERVGDFSPWLFLISGALFLTVVLSFAVVASYFRQTGGPSVYVAHAFGDFAGFQTGWLLALGRVLALAANTHIMLDSAAWLVPALHDPWIRGSVISLVCVGLTVVNCVGVRQGMWTVFALTVLKLAPLSVVVLVGLRHVAPQVLLEAPIPSGKTFGETVLLLFYAFVGFEGGVVNAGEGRDPRRDIPRAIVWSLVFATSLYFLIQCVSVAVLPRDETTHRPLVRVAEVLMGNAGAWLLTVGAVLSIGGNLSSTMIAAPRMIYALARDRCLPPVLARIHPRFATPHASVILVGALGMGLALGNSFESLAKMSTLARLIGYVLCISSIPCVTRTLRDDDEAAGGTERRVRLPGGLAIPVVAVGICLWLILQGKREEWTMLLISALVGAVLFVDTRVLRWSPRVLHWIREVLHRIQARR